MMVELKEALEVVEDVVSDMLGETAPLVLDADVLGAAAEKYQEPCNSGKHRFTGSQNI